MDIVASVSRYRLVHGCIDIFDECVCVDIVASVLRYRLVHGCIDIFDKCVCVDIAHSKVWTPCLTNSHAI